MAVREKNIARPAPRVKPYPTFCGSYATSTSTIGKDGLPSLDIWVSTRASTSDPWGTPENLDVVNARLGGGPINGMFVEGRPALSFDGTVLYFHNGGRPANLGGQGFFDIWVTTRTRIEGQD
jgi:hypothetical protein